MKEMKAKARKLFAVMLSALMVLSLTSITAFAANLGTGNGNITINNATIGQSYNIYKIFDTDSTGTGNITATEAQKTFYEGQQNNPFTFDKNVAGSYNVSVTPGKSDDDVINFLQGFVTKNEGGNVTVDADFVDVVVAGTAQTAGTATVEFSDIPYGYYLVTSSLGAVVTVDSAATVTVIDKNQSGPDWNSGSKKIVTDDGDVTEISANYGDIINYEIEFTATNYDGEDKIVSYEITDTLAAGLSYVLDNNNKVDVTVAVKENGATVATALTSGYTVSAVSDVKSTGEDGEEVVTGHKFTLTIDWTTTNDKGETVSKYDSPSTITVTYSATVTDKAVIAGEGNENTASLEYKTADNVSHGDFDESTATIYTYAIALKKVNDKGVVLAGATFQFPFYVKDTADTNGAYIYAGTTAGEGLTNTIITPASGEIVVKGVAAGTYSIIETVAPAGYNKLTDPVSVTAAQTEATTTNTTFYLDENGNVTETETETVVTYTNENLAATAVAVVNKAGTELPSTGGMGTTMLYVVGGLLIVGAGVALVVRRRMGAAE